MRREYNSGNLIAVGKHFSLMVEDDLWDQISQDADQRQITPSAAVREYLRACYAGPPARSPEARAAYGAAYRALSLQLRTVIATHLEEVDRD